MCRFAPEISAGKEENRRNPDGFQDFLTQSSGNLWREAVCGDLISGSLKNSERDLTEEQIVQLFGRYVRSLTDVPIDVDYQSVENGG